MPSALNIHASVVLALTALTASAYTFNTPGFFRDTEPPSVLNSFTALAGSNAGEINVTLDFPDTPSSDDYDIVSVRRIAGATAPNAVCNDGTPIKTYNTGGFSDETIVDAGLAPGAYYSYRVCIYDAWGNVTATQTAVNVRAKSATHVSACGYRWTQSCDAYCSGLGMTCVNLGTDAAGTNTFIASSAACGDVSGFASCGANVTGYARCRCD